MENLIQDSASMDAKTGRTCIVTRYYPDPAISGALLYSRQIIETFCSISDEVLLVCADNTFGPSRNALRAGNITVSKATLQDVGKKTIFSLLPTAVASARPKNKSEICRAIARFVPDVLVLDHFTSAWLLDEKELLRSLPARLVYSSHNYEAGIRRSIAKSEGASAAERAFNAVEYLKVQRLERALVRRADFVTYISKTDRDSAESHYGRTENTILYPRHVSGAVKKDWRGTRRKVVLSGSFLWRVKERNLINFLEAAYEPLTRHDIEVCVVGFMTKQRQRWFSERWPKANFTGPVDDVTEFLRDARIGIVAEELGGGFKLKLLDYMYSGTPILATRSSIAPEDLIEGIDLSDNLVELTNRICAVINDLAWLAEAAQRALRAYENILVRQAGSIGQVAGGISPRAVGKE